MNLDDAHHQAVEVRDRGVQLGGPQPRRYGEGWR